MSDADDSDFDKEAERERLREKYERDEEDRAAAEQMSDLLLKGATMTNAHCSECGSPIFRQNDQEFCPNCNAQAAAAEPAASEQTQADSDEQPAAEQLSDAGSGDDTDDTDPEPTAGTSIAERAAASVTDADESVQPDAEPPATAGESGQSAPADAGTPTAQPSAGDATLADAQQSLLNAITQHARAATNADPRTATDHLEAANEAAEALAELSQ